MRRFDQWMMLLATTIIGGSSFVVCAQAPAAPPDCPVIRVHCPDTITMFHSMICLTSIYPDPSMKLTYKWTVSAGVIKKGQNSNVITVDAPNTFPTRIEAKVEIGGFWPSTCANTASGYSEVVNWDPAATLLREYGDVTSRKEKAYLDRFAKSLREQPMAQAYIIVYAGRQAWVDEAKKRSVRLKNYLARKQKIEPERVTTIDGGYQETKKVEIWIVPAGANPPAPDPKVDPSEVQIRKPRKRSGINNPKEPSHKK